MKKRYIILALTVTVTLSVIIASLILINALKDNDNTLTLREHQGQVKLMRGDTVITVYDEIVIDILPQSDRNLLKQGIIIEDEEQLLSIIEDYDG